MSRTPLFLAVLRQQGRRHDTLEAERLAWEGKASEHGL